MRIYYHTSKNKYNAYAAKQFNYNSQNYNKFKKTLFENLKYKDGILFFVDEGKEETLRKQIQDVVKEDFIFSKADL